MCYAYLLYDMYYGEPPHENNIHWYDCCYEETGRPSVISLLKISKKSIYRPQEIGTYWYSNFRPLRRPEFLKF